MPFGRMTEGSKLLARNEFDVVGREFVLADWTFTGGTRSISAGRLRIVSGSSGFLLIARRVDSPNRAERFLYVVTRATTAEVQSGAIATLTDVTGGSIDCIGSYSTIARAAGELSIATEYVNYVNTGASPGGVIVAAKPLNVPHAFSLYVDGVTATARDHSAALTRSWAQVAASGFAGMIYLDALPRACEYDRYIDCTTRYVTVVDIPAGGSAEVRTAADVVLAFAAEAGGQASIDMFGTALHTAKKVVILDSVSAVVATYTATGIIEPGETYGFVLEYSDWSYSELFNILNTLQQVFLNPITAQVVAGSIIVQFEEITGSDYHELDYWNGAAWVPLATGLVAIDGIVSYVWNTDEIVLNEGAQLRARGVTLPVPDDYVLTHTTVGLLLYDDFARANGPVGGNYVEPDATLNFSRQVAGDIRAMADVWKIDGGELLFTPGAEGTYYLLLAGLAAAHTEVLVRLRHGVVGAAQEFGLVARYTEDLVGAHADFLTAYAILASPDGQLEGRAFIDGVSAHLWPGAIIEDMPNDDREIYLGTSTSVGAGDYLGGAKYDEDAQIVLQEPGITVATAGDAGIMVKKNNLNPVRFKELAIMIDGSVSVLGLEPGMYARMMGSAVYSEVEWGGGGIAIATLAYPFATVEVWDDVGTLVTSISPAAGIWGGDVFTLELV